MNPHLDGQHVRGYATIRKPDAALIHRGLYAHWGNVHSPFMPTCDIMHMNFEAAALHFIVHSDAPFY